MTKKKYKFKPRLGIWGLLVILTIALGLAVVAGAPISPWWILAPIGIPLGLMITVPVYMLLSIVLVGLLTLALIIIGIIPCVLLALVLGVKEYVDDKSWISLE